jgi:hypothetical protein
VCERGWTDTGGYTQVSRARLVRRKKSKKCMQKASVGRGVGGKREGLEEEVNNLSLALVPLLSGCVYMLGYLSSSRFAIRLETARNSRNSINLAAATAAFAR